MQSIHNLLRELGRRFRYELILMGIVVGVCAGLISVGYRYVLSQADSFARSLYGIITSPVHVIVLFLGLAALGLMVGYLTQRFPQIKGSGIPQVEGELMGQFDLPWLQTLIQKFIGGCLCICAGLSLGREGPSILLGGMTGKGVAKTLHRSRIQQKYLITCGACAGLSAAFNAPLAGVMFALEEVHRNFSPRILLSAMASAISADLVSKAFFGMQPTFHAGVVQVLPVSYYGGLVLLGIATGLGGAIYNRTLLFSQDIYQKLWLPEPCRMILPFLAAGGFGLLLPEVLGGGHGIIAGLLNGQTALGMMGILLVAKFLFSMISFGSGAPGGIFFPLLVLGALCGGIVGQLWMQWFGMPPEYLTNFLFLGMAGMFTAIVRAPLTGIILVVEMSGALTQLLSLSVVAILAYIVADLLKSAPIYESLLQRLLPQESRNTDPSRVVIHVAIPHGCKAAGKRVSQVDWPEDCLLVCITRGGEERTPHGNSVLQPGDLLSILCGGTEETEIRRRLEMLLQEEDGAPSDENVI